MAKLGKLVLYSFIISLFGCGCVSIRTNPILNLQFSQLPARALMRVTCNNENFTTQGTVVCEQKAGQEIQLSVKALPLEGRVVYSNSQYKFMEDFNYNSDDSWIQLTTGDNKSDGPIALDIMAVDKEIGVINTRGLFYQRFCDNQDTPCSHLIAQYECAGYNIATDDNKIGKCDRLAGSPQEFDIMLQGPSYQALPGAKLYLSVPKLNIAQAYDITESDFKAGYRTLSIPVPAGDTLVGLKLSWWEAGVIKSVITQILIAATDPSWTGIDTPHYVAHGSTQVDIIKPVFSDLIEINLYDKDKHVVYKDFGSQKKFTVAKPNNQEILCAFAWQRDNSDFTKVCLDNNLQEVGVP